MSAHAWSTLTLGALARGEGFCRFTRDALLAFAGVCLLVLASPVAMAQDPAHPLEPPDRSSPRAALKTFLDSADAVARYFVDDYMPHPSQDAFRRLRLRSEAAVQALDLRKLPPASRFETGRWAALELYETLSRIPLPSYDEIPDADHVKKSQGSHPARWIIPDTEIAFVRVEKGPHAGEFLFSPETVARAREFYDRVRGLPYVRPVPIRNLHEIVETGGGWMIPHPWIQSLPRSMRMPLAEQAAWKWIGLAVILVFLTVFLWLVYRVSQLGAAQHPFLQALAQFAMPVAVLVAAPVVKYLALVQLNLIGTVGSAISLGATAVLFLAGAWMLWRFAPVVAEAIIASPSIPPESIDAHLIRVTARLLGIVGGVALLVAGADRLGIPVYGIIAGLGVGGLAIALAAQPTIENLIGGMNLFADRPMRVGDLCKYGEELGYVEAIGIRSARIRGLDRTLTTIPNSVLAKMSIVNLSRRDRMLIRTVIGLRYETTPEQLRFILVKLREMLLGHPRISPDPARARFVGFGASSLDIEVYAYVMTPDWSEFLGIREDIYLRIMDIVEEGGASIAFPSQTLYLGRDRGADDGKVGAVEASVRAWRDEGSLPLPNFSPEQAAKIRGSITYPPPGSTEAPKPKSGPDGRSSS